MDEAELSAVRDFVNPSVFQWLLSDGSLESEVSEAMLILVHQWISFEQELKQVEQAMMMAESG